MVELVGRGHGDADFQRVLHGSAETDAAIESRVAEIIADVVGFKGNFAFDTSKPDGTPRKLMDVSRLTGLGWTARTTLKDGIALAYQDFLSKQG
mgnify:CR=1 FL=1